VILGIGRIVLSAPITSGLISVWLDKVAVRRKLKHIQQGAGGRGPVKTKRNDMRRKVAQGQKLSESL
jgi:hypothetical protein